MQSGDLCGGGRSLTLLPSVGAALLPVGGLSAGRLLRAYSVHSDKPFCLTLPKELDPGPCSIV
jgi:hypothetical protein